MKRPNAQSFAEVDADLMSTSPHLQPPAVSIGSGSSHGGDLVDFRRQTQLRADPEVLGIDWRLVGREHCRQRRPRQGDGAAAGPSRRRTGRTLQHPILDLTHSIAGMGINSSGVRQIAEAVGSGETQRIAETADGPAANLHGPWHRWARSCSWCSAVRFRVWTFGTTDFAAPVALLSLAHIVQVHQRGSGGPDPGNAAHRRSRQDRCAGGGLGTAISLGLVYFFREQAVVPSLVAVAAITLVVSWWYRRKIQIPAASLTAPEVREEAGALLTLGSVIHGQCRSDDGRRLRDPDHGAGQHRSRSCGPLPIRVGAWRPVCRLHSPGDGERLLPAFDRRRHTTMLSATVWSTSRRTSACCWPDRA